MQRAQEYEFAYYYIDDVSIVSLEEKITTQDTVKEEIPKTETAEKEVLKEDKIYTFQNILFEFDKAVLIESSVQELDELYAYLETQPTLYIEIYGHTDTIGTERRNNELSLQRAKAVSDYLISKGLQKSRIKWFGFGSSKPVVSNDTAAQRKINRRVEFKLKSE